MNTRSVVIFTILLGLFTSCQSFAKANFFQCVNLLSGYDSKMGPLLSENLKVAKEHEELTVKVLVYYDYHHEEITPEKLTFQSTPHWPRQTLIHALSEINAVYISEQTNIYHVIDDVAV